MMDAAEVSGILDAVYESAIFPERWPQALERLGQAFDCRCVALIDRNLRTLEARVDTSGVDASSQREFLDVWSARDLVRLRTREWRPGAIEIDHQIVPKSELLASDYYNGFMKPRDMHTVMRLTLAHRNRFLTIISLVRPPSADEFDAAAIEQCRVLMPHLERAAHIRFHAQGASAMLGGLSDVADRSVTAVLLLERDGRVKFANKAARAMAAAADGFLFRGDQFEILDRSGDAAFQRLVAGAVGALPKLDAPRGGVMRLARRSGKGSYTVTVAPVKREASWVGHEPMALVLVADPDATPKPPKEMLAQLFGFTAAEIRVAERLMMGDSPEQAATFLQVKTATARWHLASIYRKTGTNRQAELIRLLLSLAMM
ncbi:MAG: helix-turn-helix transcriptional regulator [Bradyrhizobium sp.]|nr:helix-turn-helix transcriptional regulator [Bradyrhizobium sp.]